jgi:hypothetical protein
VTWQPHEQLTTVQGAFDDSTSELSRIDGHRRTLT